jgi:GT2 family glycosyltransferase
VTDVVPVSVVVPTVGRPALVRSLLESLARCDPRADEVLVVDQSRDDAVARVVAEFAHIGGRVVRCEGQGEGRGRNVGLREAKHETVLGTDDDCTVAEDWVGRAWEHVQKDRNAIVTGRVLPAGDPLAVPSTRDDPTPRDYTGDLTCFPLFPNNMALNRSLAIHLGGFDEALPAAPDNDFCYRWLRSGRRLRYEPDLVVWHHDWRRPDELERLYVRYARGQSAFYAKHLRQGDLNMLRFIGRDVYWGARGLASALLRRRPRWTDPRRAVFSGLPVGLLAGWRAYKPGRDAVVELRRLGDVGSPRRSQRENELE